MSITFENKFQPHRETYYILVMKIVQLRLLRHTITAYHVTHTKRGNALCGLNAEFPYSTGTYTYLLLSSENSIST